MAIKRINYWLASCLLACQFVAWAHIDLAQAYPITKVLSYTQYLISFFFALYVLFEKNIGISKKLVNLTVGWFLVYFVLSLIQMAYLNDVRKGVDVFRFGVAAFFYLYLYYVLRIRGINRVTVFMLFANVIISLLLLWQGTFDFDVTARNTLIPTVKWHGITAVVLANPDSLLPFRISGLCPHPNGMGIETAACMVGLTKAGYSRKMLWLIGVMMLISFVLTQSRGGMLFTVLYISIHYVVTHKMTVKNFVTALVVMLPLFATFVWFNTLREADNFDSMSSGRDHIAADIFNYWSSQDIGDALFGIGLGEMYKNMWNILGYVDGADNGYMAWLVEFGLIGVSILLLAYAATFLYSIRNGVSYKILLIFYLPFLLYTNIENLLSGSVMIIVFYAFVFHQLDLANRRGMGEGGDMAV